MLGYLTCRRRLDRGPTGDSGVRFPRSAIIFDSLEMSASIKNMSLGLQVVGHDHRL